MKNATIKFLLPNAFPISKTGFYNEIQAPKVKISPRGVFHRALAIMLCAEPRRPRGASALTNEHNMRRAPGPSAARALALGEFVATIFATNSSILGGVMSKINRDK